MPYCPQCKSEYRSGVTHCADDGTELVEALAGDDLGAVTLVEIYATHEVIEAGRLLGLLEEEGIPCYRRDLLRAAFPTAAGIEAPVRFAVPQQDVERARTLIEQARTDGVIGTEGIFID